MAEVWAGGETPLLLDPMDFGALFMRRKQQEAAEKTKS